MIKIMKKLKVGVALTGSFCTIDKSLEVIEDFVKKGHEVTPILSYNVSKTDTRFGKAEDLLAILKAVTGKEPIKTLVDAEPIGPKDMFDVLVVAPCTGSTLGRLSNGLSDTPVTLGVKSHLRNEKPVIIAVSTNDALGASLRNIATLKNNKNLYFVPLGQDNPEKKPNSMVADFNSIEATIEAALKGVQIQPILFA